MTDAPTTTTTYCYNHPNVETHLRCNNCDRYICPRCAKLTPTGYRCPECIRGQQKVFDTTQWWDYPIAFVTAGVLSLLGSLLAGVIGFFVIFLAPAAGMAIAEVVRFLTRKRRSPQLFLIAAVGTALGALPVVVIALIGVFGGFGRGGLLSLVWLGLYLFTVTSTVYYRLRGIVR